SSWFGKWRLRRQIVADRPSPWRSVPLRTNGSRGLWPAGPVPLQARLREPAHQLDPEARRAAGEGEERGAGGAIARRLRHITAAFELGGVRRHVVGPVADVMDAGAGRWLPEGPGDPPDDLQPGRRPRIGAPEVQQGRPG